MQAIHKKITDRFSRELDFLKGAVLKPKAIGAIAPTSSYSARKIAEPVNPESGLPVLELGPGNGVTTKAILDRGVAADQLYCVEYTQTFLPGLEKRFPDINLIHGDAFDLKNIPQIRDIAKFDCVISGLPLLNFPKHIREQYICTLLDYIDDGRPIVQFSYGITPPIGSVDGKFVVAHQHTEYRNLPPMRIWAYRRA